MVDELRGVVVPALTPLDHEGRVHEAAYRSLLRYLIGSRVHGIFVGGTAGEGPLLTGDEWQRMCSIAYDECSGKIQLLGGAIDTSAPRVMERIRALLEIGYRNIVVVPTFYLKLKLPEEHLRLYGQCKDVMGDAELIAYNIPSCAGSTIPVESMCEMARRGWIRYCKDSSEDMSYLKRLLTEGAPYGLRVLIGTERLAREGLLMGAHGLVPVSANFEPSTFVEAYEARHDAERLIPLQQRISSLVENVLLSPRSWLAGAKYAISAKGFGSGEVTSPTESLNQDEKDLIDRFLQTADHSGSK